MSFRDAMDQAKAVYNSPAPTAQDIDQAIAALRSVRTRRNGTTASGQAGQVRAWVSNLETRR